jgi:hypothetical protein
MKRSEISKTTLVPLGLVMALCGVTWKLSSRITSIEDGMQFHEREIASMTQEIKTLVAMKTDVAVIREKVERLERPVYHTQQDVRSLRQQVETRLGPRYAHPFNQGPYGVR